MFRLLAALSLLVPLSVNIEPQTKPEGVFVMYVLDQPNQALLGIFNLEKARGSDYIYVRSGPGTGNDMRIAVPKSTFGDDANNPPQYLEVAVGWL